MEWFKKGKKEEGDSSKTLPRLPGSEEMPELPPLPEEPETAEFPKTGGLEPIRPVPASPVYGGGFERRTIEMEDEDRDMPKSARMTSEIMPARTAGAGNQEPVFVKLDKFNLAVENFEKVKEKVEEIEEILGKIKDMKAREDAEIKEWENEIQMIKSRINSIDSSLFSKLGA